MMHIFDVIRTNQDQIITIATGIVAGLSVVDVLRGIYGYIGGLRA